MARKYFERSITPDISRVSKNFKALLVTGPRQVGKTTLLKQIAEKKENYPIYPMRQTGSWQRRILKDFWIFIRRQYLLTKFNMLLNYFRISECLSTNQEKTVKSG